MSHHAQCRSGFRFRLAVEILLQQMSKSCDAVSSFGAADVSVVDNPPDPLADSIKHWKVY